MFQFFSLLFIVVFTLVILSFNFSRDFFFWQLSSITVFDAKNTASIIWFIWRNENIFCLGRQKFCFNVTGCLMTVWSPFRFHMIYSVPGNVNSQHAIPFWWQTLDQQETSLVMSFLFHTVDHDWRVETILKRQLMWHQHFCLSRRQLFWCITHFLSSFSIQLSFSVFRSHGSFLELCSMPLLFTILLNF